MTLNKCIIVDLDSVLSDDSGRRHLIDWNIWHGNQLIGSDLSKWKPDWEAYHAAASDDPVNEWCYWILQSIKEYYSQWVGDIIFITGRPEKYRITTSEWVIKSLGLKAISHDWKLFMRPDFLPCVCTHSIEGGINGPVCCGNPDNRPAAEVKREIYEQEVEGKYEVLFCLERDEDCCAMWKGLGLQVLRVM